MKRKISTEREAKRVRFDEPNPTDAHEHGPPPADYEAEDGFQTRKSRARRSMAAIAAEENRAADESDEEEDEELKAKRMRKVKSDEYSGKKTYGDGSSGEGSFSFDQRGRVTEVEGEEDMKLEGDYVDTEQQFEPFNLKAEMQDGYFDSSGNYIETNKDADEDDPWLSEVDATKGKLQLGIGDSASALNPTTKEKMLMEKEQEKIDSEDADTRADPRPHLMVLYSLTEPKETPIQAIVRFGRILKPKKKGAGSKGVEIEEEEKEKKEARENIEKLTESCDVLLIGGYYGVNNDTHEKFETLLGKDKDSGKTMWQIKWGSASMQTEIHGPFTNDQMKEWHNGGYFTVDTKPYVRMCREGDADSEEKWEEGWKISF